MDLAAGKAHDVLTEQGVENLYHANTVTTACQFLRAKSLLSRGSLEGRGLRQTSQQSDDLDKRYSIWFDVFLDSVDIHERASTENHYGPVLFVFDTELMMRAGRVWVTRLNPTKWADKSRAEKWFQSISDLREGFIHGQFDYMLVFRHCGGELPFKSFLQEIVLDDPQMDTDEGADYFSAAYGALRLAMSDAGLDAPISKRECSAACQCRQRYQRRGSTHGRFIPES